MESVQKYMKYRQFYARICYTKSNVTNLNGQEEIKEEIWRRKNCRTVKKEEDVVSEIRLPHM